jgi:hypothetical protein
MVSAVLIRIFMAMMSAWSVAMALTVKGIDAFASVMSHLHLPALLLATAGAQAHALRAGVNCVAGPVKPSS